MQAACKVLGVSKDATPDEIRSAYRKMSLRAHPDKPGGSNEAFQLVQNAYDTLTRGKFKGKNLDWFVWDDEDNDPPGRIIRGESYCIASKAAQEHGFTSSAIANLSRTNTIFQDEVVQISPKDWPEVPVSKFTYKLNLITANGLLLFLDGRKKKGDKRTLAPQYREDTANEMKKLRDECRAARKKHTAVLKNQLAVASSSVKCSRQQVLQYCKSLTAQEWQSLKEEIEAPVHLVAVRRKPK